MISSIAESGCRDGAAAGRVGARGVGAEPSVFPPPGNDEPLVPAPPLPLVRAGCETLPEEPEVDALGSSTPESIIRAFSGSSCSERKLTSRPWIRSTDFSRSMHAWCAFSMSSPRRRSTSRPSSLCELHDLGGDIGKEGRPTSIIVNEHGRCKSASRICALCTRPRIFAVPTPRAMPANRPSMRRIILRYVSFVQCREKWRTRMLLRIRGSLHK
ncbi:hypothetical protein EV702DRAFT_234392 [Suillus placidus]|uniref:Uncharacterized protein n=1 Tax=Suillus placidus TaxID=48579 RepID=A0A9P7A793_9AGAM|nr:hypothetical protein EV702DRAFT_234392 [Suillus placidus]